MLTLRRSYLSDLRTATLEGANGEDGWSFRDADRVPFDETLSTADRGATHDHFLVTREYLVRHIAALMAAIGGNLGPCPLASAG